jgi:hypothetical protein
MAGAITVDVPEQTADVLLPACNDWRIEHKPIRETSLPQQLYHVKDVTALSDLHMLPDKSFLVAQWALPDCGEFRIEALSIALLHILADSSVQVVANDIAYGWLFEPGALVFETWPTVARSNLYAVSPEGRYVAWVKRDNSISAIVVTDLTEMRSATIVESDLSGERDITTVVMFRTTE